MNLMTRLANVSALWLCYLSVQIFETAAILNASQSPRNEKCPNSCTLNWYIKDKLCKSDHEGTVCCFVLPLHPKYTEWVGIFVSCGVFFCLCFYTRLLMIYGSFEFIWVADVFFFSSVFHQCKENHRPFFLHLKSNTFQPSLFTHPRTCTQSCTQSCTHTNTHDTEAIKWERKVQNNKSCSEVKEINETRCGERRWLPFHIKTDWMRDMKKQKRVKKRKI